MLSIEESDIQEIDIFEWLELLKVDWKQGEHFTIIGATGTGKTTLAAKILDCREWVVAFAIKTKDDTIGAFRKSGYRIIKYWPPVYGRQRVVLWIKPKQLWDFSEQRHRIYQALESIYISGGWTMYYDDIGYIAGTLQLGRFIGVLLSQGRSSNLTVVSSMTQPASVVQRVPSESLRQVRHIVVFSKGMNNQQELKAISLITGISLKNMVDYMKRLHDYDFLYVGKRKLMIVRNKGPRFQNWDNVNLRKKVE